MKNKPQTRMVHNQIKYSSILSLFQLTFKFLLLRLFGKCSIPKLLESSFGHKLFILNSNISLKHWWVATLTNFHIYLTNLPFESRLIKTCIVNRNQFSKNSTNFNQFSLKLLTVELKWTVHYPRIIQRWDHYIFYNNLCNFWRIHWSDRLIINWVIIWLLKLDW